MEFGMKELTQPMVFTAVPHSDTATVPAEWAYNRDMGSP